MFGQGEPQLQDLRAATIPHFEHTRRCRTTESAETVQFEKLAENQFPICTCDWRPDKNG